MNWRTAAALTALIWAIPAAADVPPAAVPRGITGNWQVVAPQSSIRFSGTHAGRTFTGSFSAWTAAIRFDPARLDEANATVRITLASAVTGDKTYDKTLPESDWFNVRTSPVATFQSQKFRLAAPGKYVADGILSLRGFKVPVALPFTVTIAGDTATMAGDVTLKRMAFGLGAQSDSTGDWVGLDISVAIKVVARRTK